MKQETRDVIKKAQEVSIILSDLLRKAKTSSDVLNDLVRKIKINLKRGRDDANNIEPQISNLVSKDSLFNTPNLFELLMSTTATLIGFYGVDPKDEDYFYTYLFDKDIDISRYKIIMFLFLELNGVS